MCEIETTIADSKQHTSNSNTFITFRRISSGFVMRARVSLCLYTHIHTDIIII